MDHFIVLELSVVSLFFCPSVRTFGNNNLQSRRHVLPDSLTECHVISSSDPVINIKL